MNPIRIVARGLVSGRLHLTPELLAALRDAAGSGSVAAAAGSPEAAGGLAPAAARWGRRVSVLTVPPRRRCTTACGPLLEPEGPPSL